MRGRARSSALDQIIMVDRRTNGTLIQGGKTMPIIFGDTDGVLADHAQGGNQDLFGTDVFGDADEITDFARGGDDSVTGIITGFPQNALFGDANVMSAQAVGGNDILRV